MMRVQRTSRRDVDVPATLLFPRRVRTRDRHRLDMRALFRPKMEEGKERRNPCSNTFGWCLSESASLPTGVSERGSGLSRGRILTVGREDTQGRGGIYARLSSGGRVHVEVESPR